MFLIILARPSKKFCYTKLSLSQDHHTSNCELLPQRNSSLASRALVASHQPRLSAHAHILELYQPNSRDKTSINYSTIRTHFDAYSSYCTDYFLQYLCTAKKSLRHLLGLTIFTICSLFFNECIDAYLNTFRRFYSILEETPSVVLSSFRSFFNEQILSPSDMMASAERHLAMRIFWTLFLSFFI